MIADRVEGNLLAASQEIEKLRLLLGEGEVTCATRSRKAVADSSRYDVFKLTDAALAGDARARFRSWPDCAAEGVEPVIVLWSLTPRLPHAGKLADALRRAAISARRCSSPGSGATARGWLRARRRGGTSRR